MTNRRGILKTNLQLAHRLFPPPATLATDADCHQMAEDWEYILEGEKISDVFWKDLFSLAIREKQNISAPFAPPDIVTVWRKYGKGLALKYVESLSPFGLGIRPKEFHFEICEGTDTSGKPYRRYADPTWLNRDAPYSWPPVPEDGNITTTVQNDAITLAEKQYEKAVRETREKLFEELCPKY